MKKNIDIYLGLAAWAIGIFNVLVEFYISISYELEIEEWGVPIVWTLLVAAMYIFKQRPMRKLWWVWLSAPLAFLWWIVLILVFVAWTYSGFAP